MTRTTRSRTRSRIAVGLTAVAALLTAACGGAEQRDGAAPAAEYTLKYSSSTAPEVGFQKQIAWYMNEVEKRTGGRVTFEKFYGGSLLSSADTLPGLVDGRTETAYMVPAYAPASLPLWNMMFVPLPGTNSEVIARSQVELVKERTALATELEAAGIKILIFNMLSDIGTVITPEPITDVEGMRGLKVRALGYMSQALQLVGTQPLAIDQPEVFESIERGVIDGTSATTMDTVTGDGLAEVAPWVTQLNIGQWGGVGFAIGLDTWNGLPPDVQAVMTEVSEEFYVVGPRLLTDLEAESCDGLLAAGGGVTRLPEDQTQAWVAQIGDSLWEKWRADARKTVAPDVVASLEERYRAVTAELLPRSTYTSGLELCRARTSLG
ncbi:MAG: TRAP transporter substrate-binding protein DctP [Pseudonocardia sp.]